MSEFKKADELCELSKNDRALIVGSEIREAIQELRDGIFKRDDLIERLTQALRKCVEDYETIFDQKSWSEFDRTQVKRMKAALSAAERGGK